MNRYLMALAMLVSAATAIAAVPEPGNQSEADILNTVGSQQDPAMDGPGLVQALSPMTPTQETALHRLMKSGCSPQPKHHSSYYGYPMDCTGDPATDTATYVTNMFGEKVCRMFGGCQK